MARKANDDALRPASRTGIQALQPAAIITLLAAFDLIHWNETQTSAVMVIATAVWSFAQNYLEKRAGRAFLIAKPGPSKGGFVMERAFPWRLILGVVAVVMFAAAAVVVRDAGNWGWLIPAGLSLHAASHL